MKKPTILVTGADGQLGSEIRRLSKDNNCYNFLFVSRKDFDLTIKSDFISYVSNFQINYIINCAAYTSVDLAEKELRVAALVNESVPEMIASYCKNTGVRMIHISTNYVFGGNVNVPIVESGLVNPLSVYGMTKLRGEEKVLKIIPNAYVIRTSWVYSIFGKNFVKTMLALGTQRTELRVVYDQVGTPTSAEDLAKVALIIIENVENGKDLPGIYNYSNEGVISWYDFAVEIMKQANLQCNVTPILTSEYPTPAKRPSYAVLDKSKIKANFNLAIPYWTESLEKTIMELTG